MFFLGAFCAATGQRWKYFLLHVTGVAAGAGTVAFVSLWSGNPAGLPLGPTGIAYFLVCAFWAAWWAAAIRCPACGFLPAVAPDTSRATGP
jgi:hypothetical protein